MTVQLTVDGKKAGQATVIPEAVVSQYSMEETFEVGADYGTSVDTSRYTTPFAFDPPENLHSVTYIFSKGTVAELRAAREGTKE